MDEVWLVCAQGVVDDYGSWDPDVLAVCSSEARARELLAGLWGGHPSGVWIDRAPVDSLLDDDNVVTVEGKVPNCD